MYEKKSNSEISSVDGVGMCVTAFDRQISSWEEFLQELRACRYQPEDLRDTLPR